MSIYLLIMKVVTLLYFFSVDTSIHFTMFTTFVYGTENKRITCDASTSGKSYQFTACVNSHGSN